MLPSSLLPLLRPLQQRLPSHHAARSALLLRRAFHASACSRHLLVAPAQFDQVLATSRLRMAERAQLLDEMNSEDASDAAATRKRGQRLKALDPLHASWTEYEALQAALEESLPLLNDPDESLRAMASEEIADLRAQIDKLLSSTLPAHLLPPSSSSHLSCIIEMKAGLGGGEAGLFTREIRDMFMRFAALNGWRARVLESSAIEVGFALDGLRDCVLRIEGEGAYGRLKWEAGVHRVQRIPQNEKQGRIHTSTMAVMVLPIDENPSKDDLSFIDERDVHMEFLRSSGAGGQHVNKTESAVRLVHLPTKIEVKCQEGRSQHANRETAWTILRGKVHAHRAKEQEDAKRAARASQIPGVDRSDKIRTWNEPQDRVTDHRVPVTLSNLPSILSGENLGEVIDALQEWHLGKRLEALMAGEDADIHD